MLQCNENAEKSSELQSIFTWAIPSANYLRQLNTLAKNLEEKLTYDNL